MLCPAAFLYLFLNVSYQNVNYICLRKSVFIKRVDIHLSLFFLSFKSLLFHCCFYDNKVLCVETTPASTCKI